jgi:hypothetical protein
MRNNTTGYDLSIVNGQVKFNWYNGSGSGSVTSERIQSILVDGII